MFCMMHSTMFMGFLALAAGFAMYIWALRSKGAGVKLAKLFGLIIIVLSVIQLLCIGYCCMTYGSSGFQTDGSGPMHQMMMNGMHQPGH